MSEDNFIDVVFMRHGESEWNNENLFCGWVDVGLSDIGVEEAHRAGCELSLAKLQFDLAYTSVLRRAHFSTDIILEEIYGDKKSDWPEVRKCWELSERHYGALTGKNKAQMVKEYGKDQIQIWRRSYDVRPPPMEEGHFCFQRILESPVLQNIPHENFPKCESLKDLVQRTVPFWENKVGPEIKAGKRIIVVAHGTSLRGVVKYVKNIDDEAINSLNLPNGIPFIMKINKTTLRSDDGEMKFLADEETVKKATEKVSNISKE